MSRGSLACRPNIRLNGENPVEEWTIACACCMPYRPFLRCDSQSVGLSCTVVASMLIRVLLKRSTRPADCRW